MPENLGRYVDVGLAVRESWRIIKGTDVQREYTDEEDNGMIYGDIQTAVRSLIADASDVTANHLTAFITGNDTLSGRRHGASPNAPYLYELWELLGVCAVLFQATAGTRDGSRVRVQAISGHGGGSLTSGQVDIVLADEVQSHYHYASWNGKLLIPYGLFAEVNRGSFAAGDYLVVVANYRKVLGV